MGRCGGLMIEHQTVILQSRVRIRHLPQPTADCQSPGGLPPGIALGCELTSVRGDRGENYVNTKEKKKEIRFSFLGSDNGRQKKLFSTQKLVDLKNQENLFWSTGY